MKVKPFIYLCFVLIIYAVSGCTNLKHVYEFSAVSGTSIAAYEHIPYSYQRFCKYTCDLERQNLILTGKIKFNPLDTLSCLCAGEFKKDQNVTRAYMALQLYFNGLGQLSDRNKFKYETSKLTGAIAKLNLINDPALAEPAGKVADILLGLSTRAHRARSLSVILDKAKTPVDNLLHALILNNQILEGKYRSYYSAYLSMLMKKYAASSVSSPDQRTDYIENSLLHQQLNKTIDDIENFNSILSKIRRAHQELASSRFNLKDKELIGYLYHQAAELMLNIEKLHYN
jgi:hypothetical protein